MAVVSMGLCIEYISIRYQLILVFDKFGIILFRLIRQEERKLCRQVVWVQFQWVFRLLGLCNDFRDNSTYDCHHSKDHSEEGTDFPNLDNFE